MKIYYSILLFLCLAVKPIYTIGYIGYYEFNIDYIVEKYCVNKAELEFKCNGKCHLSKKLSLSSTSEIENSSNSKAISIAINEAFVPLYYHSNNFEINGLIVDFEKQLNSFIPIENYNVSLSISSPPPKC